MRKFYKSAVCNPAPSGFALLLDGKPARTPGGNRLLLPNAALADAVAAEWRAQDDTIRAASMPMTQLSCIALDLMGDETRKAGRLEELLAYAETDLVCYRAGDIPELQAQQSALLDPLIAWAERCFAIRLAVTGSMMPVAQPAPNQAKLAAVLADYDAWKLAALAAAVGPLGSLILALALVDKRLTAEEAFRLSHLEEAFETRQWGADEEKEKKMAALQKEIAEAAAFLSLLSSAN